GTPINAIQGIPYINFVTSESTGAKGISLTLVTIEPGDGCVPHYHLDSETALFLLSGEVVTRYGDELQHEVVARAGQSVYIGPNIPHSARNVGNVPAVAVSVRTDGDEQCRTIPYLPHEMAVKSA
ncbi:MAG: cupin domain-containing protein, partial [Chlorobia bacterium]|nr:cupin domain-containing protein [Fimbriimonadaceae bacterium]